jgi:hypothetical protein
MMDVASLSFVYFRSHFYPTHFLRGHSPFFAFDIAPADLI